MKRNSSPRDAFFKMRIVFGITIGSAGILLALLSWGVFFKPPQRRPARRNPQLLHRK